MSKLELVIWGVAMLFGLALIVATFFDGDLR